MQISLAVVSLAFVASSSLAQAPYPVGGQLRFEVWNGSRWSNHTIARPNERVEVRVVASYIGTQTNVLALGEVLYQPMFSSWDNEGTSRDTLAPWRNAGVSGNAIAGSLLSGAEGASPAALTSYGRVGYGGTGSTTTYQNVITSFAHCNGSNGAPLGSFMRIGGSFASQWPADGTSGVWTANNANRVLRGISAYQQAEFIGSVSGGNPIPNAYYQAGATDVVIFRQAVTLSDSNISRTLEFTTHQSMLARAGGLSSPTDNRRYMSFWTTNIGAVPDYRVSVAIQSGFITIMPPVPAPGAASLLAIGGAWCVRRRRGG
jgi:hypothetical protein